MGPTLIQNGKLSFWLDRPSGKKCYMISARELTIIWASGDTPQYWRWIDDFPEARFPEVAELRIVCCLDNLVMQSLKGIPLSYSLAPKFKAQSGLDQGLKNPGLVDQCNPSFISFDQGGHLKDK
ncbi:hypothetical protein Q3G72_026422 [Acer saccharum]|nr:hypothetical protein Q3G72_026422 [Acer saccharum]